MRKLISPLTLILVAFLALALAYGLVIPPFENLDEVEHFGVARYVAATGRLPIQGDAALDAYHVRQEASQPPLYYLLAGPLLRLSGISTDDTMAYLKPNPYITCGAEAIRANKATLRHDPFAEAFLPLKGTLGWHGALLALHLLRAFSTALQAFTVAGVYAIARRVFPRRPSVPLLAAALTAFNPQFLIVASGVNNDNIATPIITWAVYVTVLVVQEGLSFRRALTLGALIGLAALSKLTGLLLLPFVALAVVLNFQFQIAAAQASSSSSFQQKSRELAHPDLPDQLLQIPKRKTQAPQPEIRNPKHLHCAQAQVSEIRNLVILVSVTLVVAGWWYIRNWQLYGDPTGLAPMLDIVGRRSPASLGLMLSELGLVFRSYWGQFPCAFFDSALYYSVCALIAALGLMGAVWGLRRADRSTRILAVGLALWLALVLVGWLRWNLTTPAPGGRLLFAAVGATSTLLAYGLAWRWPRVGYPQDTLKGCAGAAAMVGVGVFALLAWVRPLFAAPPLTNAAAIHPQHPLQAQFGEDIGLLGHDLRADNLEPSRYVEVKFYWRALKPMSIDYTLALQLAALAPGDTRTLLNFNTWPGGGNLPTAAWPAGQVIVDPYRVPLPPDTGVTQAWQLQALLYDPYSGARLPLTLDAQPAGEALTLGVLRVKGSPVAALPDAARLAKPITFDQAIALTHAQVDAQSDGARVRLLWQSLHPLPRDVTVFVHAYDASGKLIATGDGPPLAGNFPMSLWLAGDQVLDEHVLTLPSGLSLDHVRVTVGLYQAEDGARLPALRDAVRLPGDEATIWQE